MADRFLLEKRMVDLIGKLRYFHDVKITHRCVNLCKITHRSVKT